MIVFKNQIAFTINTSHNERLVKTWERLSSVLDFMGPDEYTTIVPLVEGVKEDLESVVEDIEELAEEQGEQRNTEHPLITKVRDGKVIPIPLEQLKTVHQVWLEFSSILGVADRDKFELLLDLLEPVEKKLADVVFEEWETLIDKAEKGGPNEHTNRG